MGWGTWLYPSLTCYFQFIFAPGVIRHILISSFLLILYTNHFSNWVVSAACSPKELKHFRKWNKIKSTAQLCTLQTNFNIITRISISQHHQSQRSPCSYQQWRVWLTRRCTAIGEIDLRVILPPCFHHLFDALLEPSSYFWQKVWTNVLVTSFYWRERERELFCQRTSQYLSI